MSFMNDPYGKLNFSGQFRKKSPQKKHASILFCHFGIHSRYESMILSTEIYLMLDPSFLVMLVECHRTFSICNSLKNEFLSIPQDS